jgi:hypothetical protein
MAADSLSWKTAPTPSNCIKTESEPEFHADMPFSAPNHATPSLRIGLQPQQEFIRQGSGILDGEARAHRGHVGNRAWTRQLDDSREVDLMPLVLALLTYAFAVALLFYGAVKPRRGRRPAIAWLKWKIA